MTEKPKPKPRQYTTAEKPNGNGKPLEALPEAHQEPPPKKHQKTRGTPRRIHPRAREIADKALILRAARTLEGRGAVAGVDAVLDRLLPLAERQARRGKLALLRLITRWHGRRMDTPDNPRRRG